MSFESGHASVRSAASNVVVVENERGGAKEGKREAEREEAGGWEKRPERPRRREGGVIVESEEVEVEEGGSWSTSAASGASCLV